MSHRTSLPSLSGNATAMRFSWSFSKGKSFATLTFSITLPTSLARTRILCLASPFLVFRTFKSPLPTTLYSSTSYKKITVYKLEKLGWYVEFNIFIFLPSSIHEIHLFFWCHRIALFCIYDGCTNI